MTSKEAEDILASIFRGPTQLDRGEHYIERMMQRGYTVQDERAILAIHTLLEPPEYRSNRDAWRVRLVGTCLEGRSTLLVLDLRAQGPCRTVTIHEHTKSPIRRSR